MANQHDRIFKDLITNRDFAIAFLKQYLPVDLVVLVDWPSVRLDAATVEHIRQQHKQNIKQQEQSDLAFLFQFKEGNQGAAFVHLEQQTTNDATLILRTRHYQRSYLLDFIKRNKGVTKLPLIVSIIYYANKKPFSHSLDIHDYFENKALALKYAFSTQFIDLNRLSDESILNHGFIAGYELILKHIREHNIDGKLDVVSKQLVAYDHIYRQVLIKYMSQHSDMEPNQFYDRMINNERNLEDDVMTVAQQWEKMGYDKGMSVAEQWKQQGIEKGIEKGALAKAKETAHNLSRMGLSDNKIAEATGLKPSDILEIKNAIAHERQH